MPIERAGDPAQLAKPSAMIVSKKRMENLNMLLTGLVHLLLELIKGLLRGENSNQSTCGIV